MTSHHAGVYTCVHLRTVCAHICGERERKSKRPVCTHVCRQVCLYTECAYVAVSVHTYMYTHTHIHTHARGIRTCFSSHQLDFSTTKKKVYVFTRVSRKCRRRPPRCSGPPPGGSREARSGQARRHTHRGGALLDGLLRVLDLEEVAVGREDGDGAVVAHGGPGAASNPHTHRPPRPFRRPFRCHAPGLRLLLPVRQLRRRCVSPPPFMFYLTHLAYIPACLPPPRLT